MNYRAGSSGSTCWPAVKGCDEQHDSERASGTPPKPKVPQDLLISLVPTQAIVEDSTPSMSMMCALTLEVDSSGLGLDLERLVYVGRTETSAHYDASGETLNDQQRERSSRA